MQLADPGLVCVPVVHLDAGVGVAVDGERLAPFALQVGG